MNKFYILYESSKGGVLFVSSIDNVALHWDDKNEAIRACFKLFSATYHSVVYILSLSPMPIIEAVKI